MEIILFGDFYSRLSSYNKLHEFNMVYLNLGLNNFYYQSYVIYFM